MLTQHFRYNRIIPGNESTVSTSYGAMSLCADVRTRIACRAFQGIGGGGIYALISVMLYELVPPSRYPLYSTLISTVVALSPSLGPIVGGVILQGASWRWVFLFKYFLSWNHELQGTH